MDRRVYQTEANLKQARQDKGQLKQQKQSPFTSIKQLKKSSQINKSQSRMYRSISMADILLTQDKNIQQKINKKEQTNRKEYQQIKREFKKREFVQISKDLSQKTKNSEPFDFQKNKYSYQRQTKSVLKMKEQNQTLEILSEHLQQNEKKNIAQIEQLKKNNIALNFKSDKLQAQNLENKKQLIQITQQRNSLIQKLAKSIQALNEQNNKVQIEILKNKKNLQTISKFQSNTSILSKKLKDSSKELIEYQTNLQKLNIEKSELINQIQSITSEKKSLEEKYSNHQKQVQEYFKKKQIIQKHFSSQIKTQKKYPIFLDQKKQIQLVSCVVQNCDEVNYQSPHKFLQQINERQIKMEQMLIYLTKNIKQDDTQNEGKYQDQIQQSSTSSEGLYNFSIPQNLNQRQEKI